MPFETDPNWRAAFDANARAFCREIARRTVGGRVLELGSTLIVRTGIPTPSFNPVLAFEPVGDVPALVRHVRSSFVESKTPWQLVTSPAVRRGLGGLIAAFSLERKRLYPVMGLDLGPTPAAPKELQILSATDPADVRRWGRTFERGANAPDGFIGPWMEGIIAGERSSPSPMRLFLGLVDGAPVATSARLTTGAITGVYCVNTLEGHRRRGYGAAMSWAAADGRGEGCTVSCLQASAMGAPVYSAMGYRTCGEYEYWQPESPPA